MPAGGGIDGGTDAGTAGGADAGTEGGMSGAMDADKGATDAKAEAAGTFAARHPGVVAATVPEALRLARAPSPGAPSRLVVVCGSIFLVGEARAVLLGLPRDPAVAL